MGLIDQTKWIKNRFPHAVALVLHVGKIAPRIPLLWLTRKAIKKGDLNFLNRQCRTQIIKRQKRPWLLNVFLNFDNFHNMPTALDNSFAR